MHIIKHAMRDDERNRQMDRRNTHTGHFTGVAERMVDSVVKQKEEQERNVGQA